MVENATENAKAIYLFFRNKGWTAQAISGLLGNMQGESGIIADKDELGGGGGYGLVQWTPKSNLVNWANSNGLNYRTVETQCKRIQWELENGQQFYATTAYPLNFRQFTQSTQSPTYLASVFIHNYERPANPNQPQRGVWAEEWFRLLSGNDGGTVEKPHLYRAAIRNLSPQAAEILKTRFTQEMAENGKRICQSSDITINYRDNGSSAIVMINGIAEGVANWLQSIWINQYVNIEHLVNAESIYVEKTIQEVYKVEFRGLNLNDARNIRNELRRDYGNAGVRYMNNPEFITDGDGKVTIFNISLYNAAQLVPIFQDDYALKRKLLPAENIQGVKIS